MKFEPLSIVHLDSLFQFELENRTWFESLISSRGDAFYTKDGVMEHLSHCVSDAKAGVSFSGVLIEDENIIGRGNIKNISVQNKSATVGYRVASRFTGKGVATYCLTCLIENAATELGVTNLEAKVLDNNPASIAVLSKFHFEPVEYIEDFIVLNEQVFGCTIYSRKF